MASTAVTMDEPLLGADDVSTVVTNSAALPDGDAPCVLTGVLTGVVGGDAAAADAYASELGHATSFEPEADEWATGLCDCCAAPASRYIYVSVCLRSCLCGPARFYWRRAPRAPSLVYSYDKHAPLACVCTSAGIFVQGLPVCRYCRAHEHAGTRHLVIHAR